MPGVQNWPWQPVTLVSKPFSLKAAKKRPSGVGGDGDNGGDGLTGGAGGGRGDGGGESGAGSGGSPGGVGFVGGGGPLGGGKEGLGGGLHGCGGGSGCGWVGGSGSGPTVGTIATGGLGGVRSSVRDGFCSSGESMTAARVSAGASSIHDWIVTPTAITIKANAPTWAHVVRQRGLPLEAKCALMDGFAALTALVLLPAASPTASPTARGGDTLPLTLALRLRPKAAARAEAAAGAARAALMVILGTLAFCTTSEKARLPDTKAALMRPCGRFVTPRDVLLAATAWLSASLICLLSSADARFPGPGVSVSSSSSSWAYALGLCCRDCLAPLQLAALELLAMLTGGEVSAAALEFLLLVSVI